MFGMRILDKTSQTHVMVKNRSILPQGKNDVFS